MLPTGTSDLPKQESQVYNQLYLVFKTHIFRTSKLLNLCQPAYSLSQRTRSMPSMSYRLVDLTSKTAPNMVQIPINNPLPGTWCRRPRRSAKAGVASPQALHTAPYCDRPTDL